MRDDEAGAAFHQGIHCLLNFDFCPRIHTGGRFIQNQDGGICKYGSGNGKQLFMSNGYT